MNVQEQIRLHGVLVQWNSYTLETKPGRPQEPRETLYLDPSGRYYLEARLTWPKGKHWAKWVRYETAAEWLVLQGYTLPGRIAEQVLLEREAAA